MKAIRYHAPAAFGAWAKTAYLFENGIFLCEFKYYNAPKYICRVYDFQDPPQSTTWGKGVYDDRSKSLNPGAVADYQTFQKQEQVDLDFEAIKQRILSSDVGYWAEVNHPSRKL